MSDIQENVNEISKDINENIKEKREKIKSFFKDKYDFLAVFLFFSILLVYLYYFFKLGNQPIWWDEGDYLAIAKVWALNDLHPSWWEHFIRMRPVFIPFLFSLLFKIGLGEISLRFVFLLVPALLTCFLTYKISEHIFDKKTAIIATAIFSFNWVWVFYSFRVLTDIPSAFFGTLAIFFFLFYYEKQKKNYGLYLSVFFGTLSFLARYPGALILISIAVYLVFTEKFSLFKKKEIYFSLLIWLIVISPVLIFNYNNFGSAFPALGFYYRPESAVYSSPIGWSVLTYHLPLLLNNYLWIFFIIGFVLCLEFIFYLDLVFFQKDKTKNKHLFLLFLLIIPFSYFIFGIRNIDARYLLIILPLISGVCAYSIKFLLEKTTKNKNLFFTILVIILLIISFVSIKSSNQFIDMKYGSYGELQEIGEWLKQNTPQDTKIITASIVQVYYYSERQTDGFASNDEIWNSCSDYVNMNETCSTLTEESFTRKIREQNFDYLIIHTFEPYFTPSWAYDYGQKNNLEVVKVLSRNSQPSLILYKI